MAVRDEYLAQKDWRDWQSMIDLLPINNDQVVLDLGCGPGTVSALLATHCARVIGIDREREYIETARRQAPQNCEFLQADLARTELLGIPQVSGIWASFSAAYFPDLEPVLRQWATYLEPGGWVALVDVEDLLTGHHPLPGDIRLGITAFMKDARLKGYYDFCMGQRLGEVCRSAGLEIITECSAPDLELAFDGPAPDDILHAWSQRFERMQGMQHYFGAERFGQITAAFLDMLASNNHYSSTGVKLVIAKRPAI